MENAIKLAIEKGGYKPLMPKSSPILFRLYGIKTAQKAYYAFVSQDPLFWQSLGKALGWGETELFDVLMGKPVLTSYWHFTAMRYMDCVLLGGDVDAFWKELLP